MGNLQLPRITKKQQEIIELIPHYRFLDSSHIQHFLHHKYKREINRWLTDLTEQQYIERIYDNTIIGRNRRSAIYYLGAKGRKYFKSQKILDTVTLKRLAYEKDRSETFINHCLLLATICCDLQEKNSELVSYGFFVGDKLRSQDNIFHFLFENSLTTDLVLTKQQKQKKLQYFLLEIFDSTLPRYRLKKRVRSYLDFYFGNEWENQLGEAFPGLLFLFYDKAQMIYAKRYMKTLLEDHDNPGNLIVYTGMADDIKQHGITGEVWEKI